MCGSALDVLLKIEQVDEGGESVQNIKIVSRISQDSVKSTNVLTKQ